MKKFMLLAGILIGGVPSLRADYTSLMKLKSVANLTSLPVTYAAPNGKKYHIAPYATTMLDVALHHIPRSEGRSRSYFSTPNFNVWLQLDYQKTVTFHKDPYVRDWRDGLLQEYFLLELGYLMPRENLATSPLIPLCNLSSGLIRRPITEPNQNHEVHITFVGEHFERSRICVIKCAQSKKACMPLLNLACAQHLLESPLHSGSNTPVESPR